jgi:hypothetical protein
MNRFDNESFNKVFDDEFIEKNDWLKIVRSILGEQRFNEYIKSAQKSATLHAKTEPIRRYIFKDKECIEEAEFEEITNK